MATSRALPCNIPISQVAPIGFGHVYAPAHYVDAWVEVTDARDWSAEEIARLKQHLSKP